MGYKCKTCGKEYKTNISGACNKHMKTHDLELNNIEDYFDIIENLQEKVGIPCPICGKIYKNNLSGIITLHLVKEHNYNKEDIRHIFPHLFLEEKEYDYGYETRVCVICNKEYDFKKNVDNPKKRTCSKKCTQELIKMKRVVVKKPVEKKEKKGIVYKINLDNEEIKRLYVEEKMSTLDIADRMGTYKKMVRQRLLDMGVEMRTTGESKSLYFKNNPDKNPNNMYGVKEKQVQVQIELYKDEEYKNMRVEKLITGQKNMSEESKTKWKDSKKKQMLSRTPEQVFNQLMKQYDTKRKNGTFNCTGIENKYAAYLDSQGIEYIREYIIPTGGKRYRYDFYIPKDNLLVEVNGTGTHADPEKYNGEDVMKLGIPGWKVKTAEEIWHADELKRVYAVKNGYDIKTIWESEL